MKIAVTADPELPVPPALYGGIERIVDALVCGLVKAGHDVTLFAHPGSKVCCNLVGWRGSKSNSGFDTLRNTATLLKYHHKHRYDLIHSFSRLAYLVPLLPLEVPKIMSYQREPSLGQISKAVRLAKKNSLIFTGCSNYIANQIQKVAESKTVYNCVPVDKFTAVEETNENAPLIFLGRIEHVKGPHLAIEVARNAGRNLIIAGNIPDEGRLYFENEIRPHLSNSISFIGPVNDIQKNDLLGAGCALVMAIQWNEPFGIVMAESMACGTPVLGFPFGAIPEVIIDGVNGFICSDVNEMAAKIPNLNSLSRRKIRSLTEEKFSSVTIVNEYLKLYEQMANRHRMRDQSKWTQTNDRS